jgi:Bacterial conjugation TrbI-like protein
MIYILKDFFLSRNGKVLILCAAIIIASFYASKHTKNSDSSRLSPQNGKPGLWSDRPDDIGTSPRRVGENASFAPFVPIAPKPDPPVVKVRELPIKPTMEVAAKSQPPLIKEQRKSTATTLPDRNAPTLSILEEGALIHCRLLSPATTDSSNSPVIAEVTRAVIRNGITLIPKGCKIIGAIQSFVNDRVFFAPEWRLNLRPDSQLTLKAHVQERSYDHLANLPKASDGRSGLPGTVHNAAATDESSLLPALAKSLTIYGKETVRTGVGEFVPATGRNLALDGSSVLIDHFAKPADQSASRKQMFVEVPAGQEFYLMMLSTNAASDSNPGQPPTIDQLLEKLAKKRLDE